ncbi:MAG: FRG domain-containing protein [Winogradskyella sp.]|nr:MAG: FRG domain-containing protein [Winogradskyella sp.]
MKKIEITSFKDFLDLIDGFSSLSNNITLYRGQTFNHDLLPSIARKNNNVDTTNLERNMLKEFKRRTLNTGLLNILKTECDWLIYGQHYGLKTRLLDWSSNPLISLWFGLLTTSDNGYLYILSENQEKILTTNEISPFDSKEIQLLKPSFNNKRIISQSGWFTVHPFNDSEKKVTPLNECKINSDKIVEVKIPNRYISDFIKKLDIMGINSEFIFQDITGTCSYINWQFNI